MHDSHSDQGVPSTYFFHIVLNGIHSGQSDGLLFRDKAAAWREASMSCGEIIREMDGRIEPGCSWQMEVADHTGQAIFSRERESVNRLTGMIGHFHLPAAARFDPTVHLPDDFAA